MPEPILEARIGGVPVSPEAPVTFSAINEPVQVDLRFSEAYANAEAVPVIVPAGFAVTIGGADVTELPAGYLTDADAPLYFRQTAKLAQGSLPNVSLTVGDTTILLEVIEGEPVENLPPAFTVVPAVADVTHDSAILTATYSDPDGDTITAHFRINGGPWLAFSSPASLSELTPETAYIVEVRLTTAQHTVTSDPVGFNTAEAPEVPDTEAPTISGTLTAEAGDGQVTLTGPNATDNVGIAKWQRRHRVSAGEWGTWVDIASTSGTMPSTAVSPLTNGTSYEFEIRAVDAAENASAVRSAIATPQAAQAEPQLGTWYVTGEAPFTEPLPLSKTLSGVFNNAVGHALLGAATEPAKGTFAWAVRLVRYGATNTTVEHVYQDWMTVRTGSIPANLGLLNASTPQFAINATPTASQRIGLEFRIMRDSTVLATNRIAAPAGEGMVGSCVITCLAMDLQHVYDDEESFAWAQWANFSYGTDVARRTFVTVT